MIESSRHKQERRSRRDAAGSSSKKLQQQLPHSHLPLLQQEQQPPPAAQQAARKSLKKQNKDSSRDEITHFSWQPGMWLSDRYRVLAKLGDGTFGRVLRCADVRLQTQVAIKVVRDVSRYTAAAQIEADILREVNRKDRRRESRCVSLLDAFMHHQKHMCLVFECLGKSLYDVLAENKYRGFYMEDIVQVAKQGLTALAFMRDCKLAHTDLKPENILLQGEEMYETRPPRPSEEDDNSVPYLRPDSMQVKIIDFGSATFEDDYHSSLINTRQYRAPEVILDIGWDMASDMWSLGCILMELYTGDVLFRTHEHLEHLAMMERIVEPFPVEMLQKAQRGAGKGYLATDSRGSVRLKWPEGAASQGSLDRVKNCVPLESLVLPQDRLLADFVRFILQINPKKRPEPEEALRHPIFSVPKWGR
ncbi:serine/threonine-protein kinase AFC1 [Cyclospora cayetanensis]|uniref:Serine/threonine-protein kinase AFC1 n=1 Tax=Cyclospora cayetanensis TaxID=88456 RepID=A0A6P6RX97_9EIME|nr:serine/threonine-protein kinase AFC1 [Cyclospora cayetanensis]